MLSLRLNKIKVAVHDGFFHPDDVFGVAILSLYLKKKLKIFRTRDKKILAKMDYLLDVGREYDPKSNKFDHHQEDWNEERSNGIPYATSGLVWREYGEKICGSKELSRKIDEKIIQPIDAEDNGIDIYKSLFGDISPYCFADYIFSFNPTWTEKKINHNKAFEQAVVEAKKVLKREIKRSSDALLGRQKIKDIYENTKDKRILILDDSYSWKKAVSEYSETLFVVKPVFDNNTWHVNAVNLEGEKFKNRLDFPESWAGKEGKDLVEITGVKDAIFCHNKRFMAAAKSKSGAIALAKLALENQ